MEGGKIMDKKKWTFMVYMAGDNNLSDAGDTDLREMRKVGSTPDVNVVAQFDNEGDRGTNRYLIKRDGLNEEIESMGETDSGDPRVLTAFVDWAVKKYPADRHALILWNHGGGWEPSEIDKLAREVKTRNYSVREATERSSSPVGKLLFRTTIKKILRLNSPEKRAICSDDGSGHSLDTVELGKALSQVKKIIRKPIDLLGMDACLMSNLEVAYQARPYVKYIVASEESEPNEGWPYAAVLEKLVNAPMLAPADLASHIVAAYVKSYVDMKYEGPVTQSTFDLSKISMVTEPLDKLANALIAHMPKAEKEIWGAQRKSARFWHNTLWDIAHFCEELEKLTANKAVRDAAKNVRTALQSGPKQFVLAESHRGASVARCAGATIYLLPALMDVSPYYGELKYAKEHRWPALLKAYHAVV
jgi:hypothetical protein